MIFKMEENMVIYLFVVFSTFEYGTFFIVAVDPLTGECGVAVSSKVFDVGYIVPWIKTDVGAVASQALSNPYLGKWILEFLSKGYSAKEALDSAIAMDSSREERQVGVVDFKGNSCAFTGKETFAWAGHRTAPYVSVQGNILTGPEVVDTMIKVFLNSKGPLAERLLLALQSGELAGGDKRGKQSAAIIVLRRRGGYQGVDDRLVDLKVVDNPEPVKELVRQYEYWQYYFLAPAYLRLAEEEKNEIFFERTLDILERALNSDIKDANVFNNLAWEFAIRKKFPEKTLLAAKKANELAPEDPNIMDTLAEAYYAMGDYKNAIYWEKMAIEKEPDNQFFRKQLEKFQKALKKKK
jgi:uncharacterized Ntn-hydrolase superfamily protein